MRGSAVKSRSRSRVGYHPCRFNCRQIEFRHCRDFSGGENRLIDGRPHPSPTAPPGATASPRVHGLPLPSRCHSLDEGFQKEALKSPEPCSTHVKKSPDSFLSSPSSSRPAHKKRRFTASFVSQGIPELPVSCQYWTQSSAFPCICRPRRQTKKKALNLLFTRA